jgi:hypothetical protein
MKAKLIKVLDQYHLYNGDKAIATTIVGNPMLLPNLSKENCDEIFGVVDIDKLATEYYKEYDNLPVIRYNSYTAGFNKAIELSKDKVFTLEDMLKVVKLTLEDAKESVVWSGEYYQHLAKRLLQSLQQQSEIEVEIEMKLNMNGKNAIDRSMYIPKLDENGCLILIKKI